jgi:hypothetical protein
MGYVPQFKTDIFISYRHASNASEDKWVDVFRKKLEESLTDLVGKVTIWQDTDGLRAGDQWRPEIAAALDTTAIFLAVVSRTYFDSDVCRSELDCFLAKVKDSDEETRRRIVPIFKHPPKPDQELPPELAEFQDHKFFQLDPPGSHHFREFIPGRDEKTGRDFSETFSRLAQDLTYCLETLSGQARKRMLGPVYLAKVGPELHSEREKLRSDLLQRGYMVVPERLYLWNAVDFGQKIAGDLDAAKLCIHLVGRTASIEPETHRHAKLQLELAAAAMKRKGKPPPLVWIQPAKETDDTARSLINFVEQDLANEGVEYSHVGLEDFKTDIYAKLQLQQPPVSPGIAKTREIALIYEEGDTDATGKLIEVLVDKLGCDCKPIPFSVSSPKAPSPLVKALARCGQCVVFWGSQSEEWLSDILTLDPLASFGKERLCVYVAAPATSVKSIYRTTKARTIQAASVASEAELREFLAVRQSGR